MSALEIGPLFALVGLGALHGVNPAMGWLFAVALGLQERSAAAVWRALPPLALGHALSVAVVVALAVLVGAVLPPNAMRWIVAALLAGFALHRVVRGHRHPAFGGMRVTRRDLVIWSFLMATAHGAGLMVMPFAIQDAGPHAHHAAHAAHAADALHAGMLSGQLAGLVTSLVHAVAYLVVAGGIAVVVYRKVGLRLLRTAWINLDVVWVAALLITAVVVAWPAL
jgi:hypothetical protein